MDGLRIDEGNGPQVDMRKLDTGAYRQRVEVEGCQYSVRVDDAGTYQYFGWALPGSSESAAVWKISRFTVANPSAMLWADGDTAYDNVWANRATTVVYA
jgi:hypothetical protein